MTAAAAVPVGLHTGTKRGAERPNLRDPPGGTGISCRAIDHVSHHVMVMMVIVHFHRRFVNRCSARFSVEALCLPISGF
jgi:hypothetical protein